MLFEGKSKVKIIAKKNFLTHFKKLFDSHHQITKLSKITTYNML